MLLVLGWVGLNTTEVLNHHREGFIRGFIYLVYRAASNKSLKINNSSPSSIFIISTVNIKMQLVVKLCLITYRVVQSTRTRFWTDVIASTTHGN